MPILNASIIISVYQDVHALNAILEALKTQTEKNFEIIISEDGQNRLMNKLLHQEKHKFKSLQHLSQEDMGFRKNAALNRAIQRSNSDYLIFIDGDCVPHKKFIENHKRSASPGFVCSGRRLELGPRLTQRLLDHPETLTSFAHPFSFLLLAPFAYLDQAKHYEAGLYSELLYFFTKNKSRGLLGCNFSCHKKDLIAINGFNEDYMLPGFGEDSDIEWRLKKHGLRIKNIKFLVPLYHLFHKKRYQFSEINHAIFKKTIEQNKIVCDNGLHKTHRLSEVSVE